MIRNLLTLLALTVVIAPVFGHHSETAEFDQNNPVKLTGTIVKVEWLNPHVWFYVDVKDDSGKVTTWGFSNAPPGALMRRGITKDALQIGAVVNVKARVHATARTTRRVVASHSPTARTYSRQPRVDDENIQPSFDHGGAALLLGAVADLPRTFSGSRTGSRISPGLYKSARDGECDRPARQPDLQRGQGCARETRRGGLAV